MQKPIELAAELCSEKSPDEVNEYVKDLISEIMVIRKKNAENFEKAAEDNKNANSNLISVMNNVVSTKS